MVPVAVDGLVELVVGPVLAVEDAKLVVEAVLAGQDDDEDDIAKRPKNEPKSEPDGYTAPIWARNGSF